MLRKVLDIRVAVSVCAVLVGTLLSATSHAADAGENAAFKHHCVTCHGYTGSLPLLGTPIWLGKTHRILSVGLSTSARKRKRAIK